MAITTCEVTWLLYLLRDLHVLHNKLVLMYCDNQAALHIAANLVFHEKSKHIDVDCHIVRNRILDGAIKIFYVSTKNALADVFTKALGVDNFLGLVKRLGISNIFAHSIEYPECVIQKQEARDLIFRGSVEIEKENPNHRNKVQVTKERSNDQVVVAKSIWASKELLELIEAMPYCEQFIVSFEQLVGICP